MTKVGETTKKERKSDVRDNSKLIFAKENAIPGIITDITEHTEIEGRLKQERDMLENVTQSIGAGLVVINKDYRVLWTNNYIRKVLGDIEGEICHSAITNSDTICPDCGVKKVFEGASFDTRENFNPILFSKGSPAYWFEIIATPIKEDNGNVAAALELKVDITEKKIMQGKLADYFQKLEKTVEERTEQLANTQAKLVKSERLAAVGELAGMVGHDLRNPLAGMTGAVYYLRKNQGGKMNDTEMKMLQTIEDCILYSDKIVNDLLEYSQEIKLEISETTPKELLKTSLSKIEVPSTIKVIDATENKPKIMVDVTRMNRVFLSLARNAFDAMPNGGTLKISSKTLADSIEFTFTDNGMGMSKETLDKLWMPLFTTKAKGMGFGLAICKRFVEAHGGKISVTSTSGKGTTFTLSIPIKPRTPN
jgi:signal transduction histidine kinase